MKNKPPSRYLYPVSRDGQFCGHCHTSMLAATKCAQSLDAGTGERLARVFQVKRSKLPYMHGIASLLKNLRKRGDTWEVHRLQGRVTIRTSSLRRYLNTRDVLTGQGLTVGEGVVIGDCVEFEVRPGEHVLSLFRGMSTRDAYAAAAVSWCRSQALTMRDCRPTDGHDPYKA